jgi:hypothetical protein
MRSYTILISFPAQPKMSHGLLGRGSCLKTTLIPLLQFDQKPDTMRHDRAGGWLSRLVRLFGRLAVILRRGFE